ncbi:MAG TPA: parallel beta-helix domain-containing protein [Kofleriaceae bacterium]|nr:parallel beta-helix domain-containing protein [Kofleriaceae bacterium]
MQIKSMFLLGTSLVAGLGAGLTGCGDDKGNPGPDGGGGRTGEFTTNSCTGVTGTCKQLQSGDDSELQTLANSVADNTTIVLSTGTFKMSNQLTIRNKGIHLIGQGMDKTTLDFGKTTTQGNGVDVAQGDGFLIQDLKVLDAPKDGIRVENTNGVVFRRIYATWTTPSQPTNGAYGIYPVHSQNVLVENSKGENASDSGLYVGQCQHVVVRNNTVMGNVAGLEIENTEYADVYGNTATDNTGGIVVFDLPGNPIIGRDIRVHDNMIIANNHENFSAGGTVASIPVGTGTFAMASRRVEITNNTYQNNHTGDIALVSGLTLEPNMAAWALDPATIVGDYTDLNLPTDGNGKILNFQGGNIVVAGNHHSGSGTMPAPADPLHIGLLLTIIYKGAPVDSVLYDTIGETKFDSTDPAKNSNNNHMCVGGNTEGTFASMDILENAKNPATPFFRPAAPFAPFDCTAIAGNPIAPVTLPTTLP